MNGLYRSCRRSRGTAWLRRYRIADDPAVADGQSAEHHHHLNLHRYGECWHPNLIALQDSVYLKNYLISNGVESVQWFNNPSDALLRRTATARLLVPTPGDGL